MNENTNINPLDREKKATDVITLRQLLSGRHVFRVPDYQRGYAWDEEFRVLWKDIKRLYKAENTKHYTGMLALQEISDEHVKDEEAATGTSAFYIVDGQQRITSFVIIINSLITHIRNELPDRNMDEYDDLLVFDGIVKRFGYSYQRKDDSSDYFEERIYKNNTGLKHADQYLSNINAARDYIDSELKKKDLQEVLGILNAVLDRMVFNLYFVTDDFDVRVTFETINNRGKRLSNLELLKNRLMYLTTFFPQVPAFGNSLKMKINDAWKNIYKNLCYGEEQLPDDSFLKAHWIVWGRLNKRKGDAYIEDLLSTEFADDSGPFCDYLQAKEYSKAYDHIKEYIDSLSKYSLFWAFVNKPESVTLSGREEKETNWIKRLSRISNTLYLRSALMFVTAEDSLIWTDKESYYSKIERFIFTNNMLAHERNDLSFLVTSVKKLVEEQTQKTAVFKEIISELDEHDLHVDTQRIVNAVNAFKLNTLSKEGDSYYDWRGLPYFLYEYNDSLAIPNAAVIEWYQLNRTSIEHILPQTPESPYWKTAFGMYNEDEKKNITNSLGNLLLLSCGAENSSLRNYSFPTKKDMPVSSGKFAYTSGSRSAREIAESECWTINEISDRTDKLIRFMYDHWFAPAGVKEEEWKDCASVLRNGLPKKLKEDEYLDLKTKLSAIDTSYERDGAEKSVQSGSVNRLQEQFLDYIDRDQISIKYNKTKIYWKRWFTFTISSENGVPDKLRCGVELEGIKYTASYKYKTNELSVVNRSEDVYIMDAGSLPEDLRYFLSSLSRYVRDYFGKPDPVWLEHS